MKPTWRYYFCLSHSHNPKPKRNHQIASNRAKTRSRRSETCVKYRGIIICIKRNTDVKTRDLKILYNFILQIRLIFQTLPSISPNFHVVCLQPNSWLESYDRYGSFGTVFWGSLIVSPVIWFLSSGSTLSATHSDIYYTLGHVNG